MTRIATSSVVLAVCVAGSAHAGPLTNWRYDDPWPAETQTVALRTGLEARTRIEGFKDNLWGAAEPPDDLYVQARLMPHADLRLGAVRGFVQAIAGYAEGVSPAKGPVDQTGLDLLQGFVDARADLGFAQLTVRYGRALTPLGSERLVGARYGANTPQPFEGARVLLEREGVRLDLFRLRPVQAALGDFNDHAMQARRIEGAWLTAPAPGGGVSLYLLSYLDAEARLDGEDGRERRHTLGARFNGSREAWAWDAELMVQRGRIVGLPVRAWSLQLDGSRRLDLPLRPRLRVKLGVASGDGDPDDGHVARFNPLFYKPQELGELSPVGAYNQMRLSPSVSFGLAPGVSLDLRAAAYWRHRLGDGVYALRGARLATATEGRGRFVGGQAEAVLDASLGQRIDLTASYSRFAPGGFLRAAGRRATIQMLGLEARYRF